MKMKIKFLPAYVCLLLILLSVSCVKRIDNTAKTQEAYQKSLDDSIAKIQWEIDSCKAQIKLVRDDVSNLMRDFTTVSNSKEVAPYTIMTEFASDYPLTSTGLAARLDENGKFELIAALAGGNFDRIIVECPDNSITSQVVKYDQALNYRNGDLNTVLFTGENADSIGRLIADNELNQINVIFMQASPVKTHRLSNSQSKMVSMTWLLFNSRNKLNKLELRVPMLHEKINLLRSHKMADK